MMNAANVQSILSGLAQRIIRLPRAARIVLAGIFAIALTLLVTPVVDGIYSSSFYDPGTLMLPSLVSTALGVMFYVVGWRLMIGYAGENPTPSSALFGYFVAGAVIVLIVLVLVIVGAISGTGT